MIVLGSCSSGEHLPRFSGSLVRLLLLFLLLTFPRSPWLLRISVALLPQVLVGGHEQVGGKELIPSEETQESTSALHSSPKTHPVGRFFTTDLMNLSSRGLSSRVRGSTRSGNWAMERHSRLRKLGKSLLPSGSEASRRCSRKSSPTSPLAITSQPGSRSASGGSSSLSCNSLSGKKANISKAERVFFSYHEAASQICS